MAPIPVHLSNEERYRIFADLNLEAKAKAGLIEKNVEDRPVPPKYIAGRLPFPPGTVSQKIYYMITPQDGEPWLLAKVHQYLLPDGTIRGGPDPLYIRLHDVVLTRTEKPT